MWKQLCKFHCWELVAKYLIQPPRVVLQEREFLLKVLIWLIEWPAFIINLIRKLYCWANVHQQAECLEGVLQKRECPHEYLPTLA